MPEPIPGKQSWTSSPDELHSELMVSRFNLTKEFQDKLGFTQEEAIQRLQKGKLEDLEWINDDMANRNYFWRWRGGQGPDMSEQISLLKSLPSAAALVGTGAALRSGVGREERTYQNGGYLPNYKYGGETDK